MLLFLMVDDDLGDQSHNDDFPLVVLVLIFTVDFDENMCPTSFSEVLPKWTRS